MTIPNSPSFVRFKEPVFGILFARIFTGLCKSVLSYRDTIRIPYFIFVIGSIEETVNKNEILSYSGMFMIGPSPCYSKPYELNVRL